MSMFEFSGVIREVKTSTLKSRVLIEIQGTDAALNNAIKLREQGVLISGPFQVDLKPENPAQMQIPEADAGEDADDEEEEDYRDDIRV